MATNIETPKHKYLNIDFVLSNKVSLFIKPHLCQIFYIIQSLCLYDILIQEKYIIQNIMPTKLHLFNLQIMLPVKCILFVLTKVASSDFLSTLSLLITKDYASQLMLLLTPFTGIWWREKLWGWIHQPEFHTLSHKTLLGYHHGEGFIRRVFNDLLPVSPLCDDAS